MNQLIMSRLFTLMAVLLSMPALARHVPAEVRAPQGDSTVILTVAGNCGMCKNRIEQAAKEAGAKSAAWDAESQQLRITITAPTSLAGIRKNIAATGHDVDGLPADGNAYQALPGCCQYSRTAGQLTHAPVAEGADSTAIFEVAGVCGMCKSRIEQAAQAKGLETARWDAGTQMLSLLFDPAVYDVEAAKKRILAVGHDVAGHTADANAYRKLPACCHYHDENNVHRKAGGHDHGTDTENHDHEHTVTGVIMRESNRGELSPIESANIHWLEAPSVSARSDASGVFRIPHEEGYKRLVVTHAGHQADTITVTDPHEVVVVSAKGNVLSEVAVSARRSSNYIAALSPSRLEVLTAQELFKAACCDLSESFETNASVDVVNSDAVTGSKQIQMLGLSGIYTQLSVENLPGPRGLATPLGLNSISGAWIESIQIGKGIGSVVNGFENIAGQINVELKKPETSERLYFNAYTNNAGRSDINLNLAHRFNERWTGGLLLHDNFMYNKNMNFSNNGFRDIPVGNLFSGINRWKYENGKGFMLQFGVKFLNDKRTGGQVDFDPATDKLTENRYGLGFDIERYEAFAKIGYVFPQNTHRSVGLQLSGTAYKQESYFGLRTYDAEQRNAYANLIYQDIIGTVVHKYRTGLSLQYDRYDERYAVYQSPAQRFARTEAVPGGFFEYTYSPSDKFDAVLGIRGDYNSLYGWFATPRAHVRYQPVPGTTFRLSSGRGQRTANILAENTAALASARMVRIAAADPAENAYGLRPEIAWNTGLSFDQSFRLFHREASFSAEFFRNDFVNQVVVDYENPRELVFYNLDGQSYSNSVQTEFRFMPLPHLEARLAYRFFDVKTTYGGELLQRPLVARHRGFLNLGYRTHSGGWHFDYTLNLTGQKRLPSTAVNPEAYQMPEYSRSFAVMNAQVSKTFGKTRPFDVYIGGENLTNFFQPNPVLAADQPFSDFFDTSLLWGPITGRMFYAGIRFGIR
ncbi:Outer membrane receptor proteins, mostly Fe transport [Parapedobacter composti]|uniref:Outer membrane receptor proteins, mostly Fe transport n=2 Tax=Parapedobacter composti TaxID=623281 RepID=A0A1I1LFY9_9SPHI|nr:Outer membrane receptor proteins, mostly Fe transport [Parapedobacter composti]